LAIFQQTSQKFAALGHGIKHLVEFHAAKNDAKTKLAQNKGSLQEAGNPDL